ncbi:MAG TPA: efflux RND transporter periplasmic adaptor subunit [Candidatus Acidoferrales bacterium]|nr:efflux RND transporter periplasmic adaptor subunit [Candidatus Acidoferrales bacterium]
MSTQRHYVVFAFLVAALCGVSGCSSSQSKARPASPAPALAVDVTRVVSKKLSIIVRLPGEIRPYEIVAVYPKVTGFLRRIGVDRGSRVKKGQLLARLTAPELDAERQNAEARLRSEEATLISAEAKFAADESTYQSLQMASTTPGVISGNELQVAKKKAEADKAQMRAARERVAAARASLSAARELAAYLQVRAPFDGIVTERNAHPGDLVGPAGVSGAGSKATAPMLRIETLSRLRLVVPVPEIDSGAIVPGALVHFSVPAFPTQIFSGTVSRISRYLHVETRTMPVELDVANPRGQLYPGMFPEVEWPVRRPYATLFVPASAITNTTQGTFVLRVRAGQADRVEVKTGETEGNLVEVFGDLKAGDEVALHGTEEIPPGSHVAVRLVAGPK